MVRAAAGTEAQQQGAENSVAQSAIFR